MLGHDKLFYEEQCTNKHNFEKLVIPNKEKLRCRNCGFTSRDMSDFAGSNAEPSPCTCGCAPVKRSFYCKKVACKSKGGFSDVVPGQTHMHVQALFPKESDQRIISAARLSTNSSSSLALSQKAPLSIENQIDELYSQAEKLFKKVVLL